MIKNILLITAALVILLFSLGLLLYRPVIRPWSAGWGASQDEAHMPLVGDEILKGDVNQTTRAIDVRTQPARIWPWLMQIGQNRGGLYSYDWLENLAGCEIHTLDTIVPELQNLHVGDQIKLGPQKGLPYYTVEILQPGQALVLRSANYDTGEPGGTWGFYLVEKSQDHTRLIIRHRDAPSQNATERTVNAIFEPISFIMEHRMLYGLRDHAEKLPSDIQ